MARSMIIAALLVATICCSMAGPLPPPSPSKAPFPMPTPSPSQAPFPMPAPSPMPTPSPSKAPFPMPAPSPIPAPSPPPQPPFYRYVSVTVYNATANVSQIVAWENSNLKNCKSSFISAVIGVSVNYEPKPNYGQFVKVIDFSTPANYTLYKTCDDAFTYKPLINSFVLEKSHAFVAAAATNKRVDQVPDNVFFHVGLSNVTNTTTILPLRAQLITQFAGASVIDAHYAVFDPASPVIPSNNHNHANILITNVPNTLLSYYYFKNGNNGTVTMLPVYAQIKALQPTGGRDTEFPAIKIN